MTDMRLVVVGAAGRMGQTLIRAIHAASGVTLSGAVERKGSPMLGKDAGELAGVGPLGVAITDDPLPVFAKADGVLDFTMPAATVEFAGYAAQARIVHVIGTTGCSAEDEAKIAAAARHATIVKSGNYEPRRQPPGGAGRTGRARRSARRISTSRSSKCTTSTRSTRPPAPRCCSAKRRPKGAASSSTTIRVRVARRPYRRAGEGTIGFATLRGGSVVGDHSVIFAGAGEQHHPVAPRRGPLDLRRAARSRRPVGPAARSPGSIRCATCSASTD